MLREAAEMFRWAEDLSEQRCQEKKRGTGLDWLVPYFLNRSFALRAAKRTQGDEVIPPRQRSPLISCHRGHGGKQTDSGEVQLAALGGFFLVLSSLPPDPLSTSLPLSMVLTKFTLSLSCLL